MNAEIVEPFNVIHRLPKFNLSGIVICISMPEFLAFSVAFRKKCIRRELLAIVIIDQIK